MWGTRHFLVFFTGSILSCGIGVSGVFSAEVSPHTYDLKTIIQLAIDNNPSIEEALGLLDEQYGRKIGSGAYPNPTLYGQTGRGAVRDPSSGNSRTEWLLSLNQPVEWPGTRKARRQAAEAQLESTKISVEEARLNIVAAVHFAFFNLLHNQQETLLVSQNLSTIKELFRITKIRVKTGESPMLEAVKAQVEALKANQDMTRVRNSGRAEQIRLNLLTGGSLGQNYSLEGPFRSFPKDLDPDRLITQALAQHPSIRKVQKEIEQAGFTLEKERQKRIPNVTVFGGYAREIGREAVIGGLSLPTPIWYQQKGEITVALGTKRKKEAELHRIQNAVVQGVTQSFQDAATASDLINVFEKGLLKQAQEVLRIATISFRQGEASLLQVLDAQRVAHQIQLDYIKAQRDLSFALARLEQAIGKLP